MKILKGTLIFAIIISLAVVYFSCSIHSKSDNTKNIIGWNILSSNESEALEVIDASVKYDVNHLQLSHNIIHDLNEIKDPSKAELVNKLIKSAHDKGIQEVVVWDHALYDLDYYPEEFKSEANGKLNLDNPLFWKWIKDDYRNMLNKVPEVDGIVLTFIETGARIEEQYSDKLVTSSQKQAALIDSLASIIIDEFALKLYIRTFIYNQTELSSILKSLDLIKHPEIIVMCKETPHDFFITHPVSHWIQNIRFPVIIEFDCAHEFNGQGVVSSIFPEVHANRWEYYKSLPNVIGFSIRTDRYGTTTIIDRPSEINLFAIHSLTSDPSIGMEKIYDNFILDNYGEEVLVPVKQIFKNAPQIIMSVYYTLGLNTTNHSSLNFDYRSIYTRHVSGRWMENPNISVDHGVNKEFHYWTDIVNHLSPARHKMMNKKNIKEIPKVLENKWVQPIELMNEEYLSYIITEKEFGCKLAKETLGKLRSIENDFSDSIKYSDLYNTFERTKLSSDLFLGMAKAYYGYRIFNRGESYRNTKLINTIKAGLDEIKIASETIKEYKKEYPIGQYNWKKDAEIAMEFFNEVSNSEFKTLLNENE